MLPLQWIAKVTLLLCQNNDNRNIYYHSTGLSHARSISNCIVRCRLALAYENRMEHTIKITFSTSRWISLTKLFVYMIQASFFFSVLFLHVIKQTTPQKCGVLFVATALVRVYISGSVNNAARAWTFLITLKHPIVGQVFICMSNLCHNWDFNYLNTCFQGLLCQHKALDACLINFTRGQIICILLTISHW